MHILIASKSTIPAINYGGIERVIWYLGKALLSLGHKVTYLVNNHSICDFAPIIFIDESKNIAQQIPANIDVVHFNFNPNEQIEKPYIFTMHGNLNDRRQLPINTVFVSKNHAERFASNSFVYNGMDWNDYSKPNFTNKRNYFHFLGNAAWRLKNVKGAIEIIKQTPQEKLKIVGGTRLNINMGFRFTTSLRTSFYGMVGGQKKDKLLNGSKGLIFPVKWHEPFGIAIIESFFYGCPVFGTPYGSLPELVNEQVGFLSNNSTEIAEKIVDAGIYSAQICHQYAQDLFDAKTMALAYLQKYEAVLNEKKLNQIAPQLKEIQTEKFLPFE